MFVISFRKTFGNLASRFPISFRVDRFKKSSDISYNNVRSVWINVSEICLGFLGKYREQCRVCDDSEVQHSVLIPDDALSVVFSTYVVATKALRRLREECGFVYDSPTVFISEEANAPLQAFRLLVLCGVL